jgi:catechol 2,3-dioxygenase-like lactoylglutathione lyase family enzyme
MIDHIGIPVSDYARAKAFYTAALAPLGYGLVMEATPEQTGDGSSAAGFGKDGKPDFWISTNDRPGRTHVAILATGRDAVHRFHDAALAAGATDNGAPGLRPHYHPDYYGAFVLDPDGHNIEAVCHLPEAQA